MMTTIFDIILGQFSRILPEQKSSHCPHLLELSTKEWRCKPWSFRPGMHWILF